MVSRSFDHAGVIDAKSIFAWPIYLSALAGFPESTRLRSHSLSRRSTVNAMRTFFGATAILLRYRNLARVRDRDAARGKISVYAMKISDFEESSKNLIR